MHIHSVVWFGLICQLYSRHLRFDPAQRANAGPAEHPALASEDSNSNLSQEKWGDYYMNEDDYAMQEPNSEPECDSDFEYEGGKSRKGRGKKGQVKSSSSSSRPSKGSSSRSRREEEKTPSSDRIENNILILFTTDSLSRFKQIF